MTTGQQPPAVKLHEGIEIMLDGLGVTIDDLDARQGRFSSDDEKRAWFLADALRRQGVMAD